MWAENILTAQTVKNTSKDDEKSRQSISFHGVVTPPQVGIGTYGHGYVQINSSVSSRTGLGITKFAKYCTAIHGVDLNGQYQRLLEKPLFTIQEYSDCKLEILKLQNQFFSENFDNIKILCQEANWPIHYKNFKPVSYTNYGECYLLSGVHLTLAKDIDNMYEERGLTCRKILKHKLKGAEYLQANSQNQLTTPMIFMIDYFGQRFLVSSRVHFAEKLELKLASEKNATQMILSKKIRVLQHVTSDIDIIAGDDSRKYIFSSSRVLPPLAPLFLCSGQKWLGILYPISQTDREKVVFLPYILLSNPLQLLQQDPSITHILD